MIMSCYVAENQTQVLLVIKQLREERFTKADRSIAQSIFKGDQDKSSRWSLRAGIMGNAAY